MKKLYRSKKNRIIAGLLGGIGEYFSVDAVWVRFLFVVVLIFSEIWPAVIVYIVGYFMVPEAPDIEILASESTKET